MNNPIKLVALDLDGTLYDNQKQISQENINEIKRVIKKGVEVIISTGRPYVGLPFEKMQQLGIRYAITTNGAAIYEVPEKKCLYENCLDKESAIQLLKELEAYDVYCDVFINGEGVGSEQKKYLIDKLSMPDSLKAYIKRTRYYVNDLINYLSEQKEPIQKITVDFYSDGTDLVDRELVYNLVCKYNNFTVVSGGCDNIEITNKGTNKGIALVELCKKLNISIQTTMACGDSENDKDILLASEYGIAMGNAEECVKKIAKFISKTNIENGVAYALSQFIPE